VSGFFAGDGHGNAEGDVWQVRFGKTNKLPLALIQAQGKQRELKDLPPGGWFV